MKFQTAVPPATQTTAQKTEAVRWITWAGLWTNLVLAGFKFFAGLFGNSSVLIADAVHSLSDLATDVAVLVGSRFWGQPADEDHPHGHAKIEMLVTLGIGAALIAVAFGLLYDAVFLLWNLLREKPSVSPTWLPFLAAVLSIVVKEFLYRVTYRIGQGQKSPAVIANAWHHRSDALSSIPAAIAVLCCLLLGPQYTYLDPVGTIIVSIMIVYAALEIMKPSFKTLLDAGAPKFRRDTVAEIVGSFPRVCGLHKLRTRLVGLDMFDVEVHIQVDPQMTVSDAHTLSHQIQIRLTSEEDIGEVFVHIEPNNADADTIMQEPKRSN